MLQTSKFVAARADFGTEVNEGNQGSRLGVWFTSFVALVSFYPNQWAFASEHLLSFVKFSRITSNSKAGMVIDGGKK